MILLYIFVVLVVFFVGWRLLSYRYVLPCPSWLAWMVEMDNPFIKVNRAATIIQNLQVTERMTVLDAGCGPARVTIPLAKRLHQFGKVLAMDIQEKMLDKVKNKAEQEKLSNIEYLHAGLGESKLFHNSFDRVVLVTVLGEIPKQKEALQEVYNTLKLGGILSVTELIFDPHFQSKSSVLKIAREVGFKEKESFGSWYAYTLNLEKH